MSDETIRDWLLQSQPEVYRAGGDASARLMLKEAAQDDPAAVLEVLLEDLIWGRYLVSLVDDENTLSLDKIQALAQQGDFELAHERTRLSFGLENDRALLLARFKAAAERHLTE